MYVYIYIYIYIYYALRWAARDDKRACTNIVDMSKYISKY